MKTLLFLFCLWTIEGSGEILSDEEKASIALLEMRLQKVSGNDVELCLKLASLYERDQEEEKGLAIFLKALELTPAENRSCTFSTRERKLYRKALRFYLGEHGQKMDVVSRMILDEYGAVVEQYPEYLHLSLIVAAAHANLGDLQSFFDMFYRAYRYNSEHYLANKIVAVLHVKLLEKLPASEARRCRQKKIIEHLHKAIAAKEFDIALYKMLLIYSPENEKVEAAKLALDQIIEHDQPLSRADLAFFISHFKLLEDRSLLEQLVRSAKLWYPYSRLVQQTELSI